MPCGCEQRSPLSAAWLVLAVGFLGALTLVTPLPTARDDSEAATNTTESGTSAPPVSWSLVAGLHASSQHMTRVVSQPLLSNCLLNYNLVDSKLSSYFIHVVYCRWELSHVCVLEEEDNWAVFRLHTLLSEFLKIGQAGVQNDKFSKCNYAFCLLSASPLFHRDSHQWPWGWETSEQPVQFTVLPRHVLPSG